MLVGTIDGIKATLIEEIAEEAIAHTRNRVRYKASHIELRIGKMHTPRAARVGVLCRPHSNVVAGRGAVGPYCERCCAEGRLSGTAREPAVWYVVS